MVYVSFIYVYFNTPCELLESVKSIKNALGPYSAEIIIYDNNSPLKVPKEINNYSVRVLNGKKNLGYGSAANLGAKIATGKYLVVLNPDVIFVSKSIKSMIERMEDNSNIGILGPAILDKKMNITNVGNGYPFFPGILFAFSYLNKLIPKNIFSKKYYLTDFDRKSEKEIPVICGACMMISRKVFEEIKGFDINFFMYFEESDLSYRINRAGYKVIYYPKAKVIHYLSRSIKDAEKIQKMFEKSRFTFVKKYQGTFIAILCETILRLNRLLSVKKVFI